MGFNIPLQIKSFLIAPKKGDYRIINKVEFDAHTDPLFKDNQIFKFKDIYFYNLGKFMFLYINNRLPRNVDNLVYMLRIKQVHGHGLRRAELLYHCVELSYVNSLCPIKVQVFLIHDIRNAPTRQQFQFKLRNFLFSRLHATCF